MQSIEVPPRRHFKHAEKAHQGTGPRFKPTATAPHPLHGGFVIPPQQNAVTPRRRSFSTQNHENPRRNDMPNNASTLIDKSSSQPTDPLEPQNRDRSWSLSS